MKIFREFVANCFCDSVVDNCNLEVVLLPCGHAFHVLCMTDPSCSICLDDGLETMGWK